MQAENSMILMNDFLSEGKEVQADIEDAVADVIRSGWYVLGERNLKFAGQWAKACGVDYVVGVANGLDAIEIALRSLDIGPGDEVITTGMTAFATVLAIVRAGAVPVIGDIDPTTGLLDPASAARCLSNRTRAVIPVHLYGQLARMDEWLALCSDEGLHLIEDCAQAHLASHDGRVAGSFGVAGAYSFYPTKNLGAFGDAGALVTNDTVLAERASRIRNYGQSDRYHHVEWGMNSRLDEIQASILSVRLKYLERWTCRRQSIARRYHDELVSPHVKALAAPVDEASHVYHLFVVTCINRSGLQAHLHDGGVQTHAHYPVPAHLQPICEELKLDPQGLSNTEHHAKTCLSLPCHPQMTDEQVSRVVDLVNRYVG
jgi:dTDP-4-amino-4,6-dideoxygalactose transaminase